MEKAPSARVLELLEGHRLTPTQRRIAQSLVEHASEVAFMSSSEVAELTGVSQPSVTRFAMALGYDGYPDLRRRLRELHLGSPPEEIGDISSVWMMSFGCFAVSIAEKSFDGGSVSFVAGMGGSGTHWLFSLIIVLGIVAVNVLNLYGMFMCVTTTLTALAPMRVHGRIRAAFVVGSAIVGTVIAIAGSSDFLSNFENFILFLAYFLIPWTAINLVDFYFVRKERYDIDAIFDPNGIYGKFNLRSAVPYVVAVLVEIPFMSTTFYTGPLVKHLGGADISWIIGLILASVLYYIAMIPVMNNDRQYTPQLSNATDPTCPLDDWPSLGVEHTFQFGRLPWRTRYRRPTTVCRPRSSRRPSITY